LNVAVIGAGSDGIELANCFEALARCNVHLVQDWNFSHLMNVREFFPHIAVTTDLDQVWTDESLDVVIIAVPEADRFEIAHAALNSGKHVLLNGPVAHDVLQANVLQEFASERNLVLGMHLATLYHPIIEEMSVMLAAGQIGRLAFITSERQEPPETGRFEQDIIWHLALPDVAMALLLARDEPVSVSATAFTLNGQRLPGAISIVIHFSGSQFSQHLVNRLSPERLLRFQAAGTDGAMRFRPDRLDAKLQVCFKTPEDASAPLARNIALSADEILPPRERLSPPLRACAHFAASVLGHEEFRGSGALARNVVRVLAAASRSLRENGALITLA
jgi:UDP-2-acetamido-3-amino-2,3-dideoxy-glucuronate N-acetyltransferase